MSLLVGPSFTCSEKTNLGKTSGEWFDWSWGVENYTPYIVRNRKNRNTMNDLVEAAVDMVEDATSIAEELLDKWYFATKENIDNGSYQYSERVKSDIDQKYREYKNKIDRLRSQ